MELLILEFVWQRKETDMHMKNNTVTVNTEKSVTYTPVDSDFRLKNNVNDISIDDNFIAQNFWKDVLIR